jgi:hypothetical protein
MTNAVLTATVAAARGRELTLSYPGGSQQIIVPEDAFIFTPVEGERSLLAPGVFVTLLASRDAAGSLTTTRVQLTRQ